jgi:hypothetical protein
MGSGAWPGLCHALPTLHRRPTDDVPKEPEPLSRSNWPVTGTCRGAGEPGPGRVARGGRDGFGWSKDSHGVVNRINDDEHSLLVQSCESRLA